MRKSKVLSRPVIVVEDDPFTRLIPIILDPASPDERRAAFADFMAHDEPDFDGWLERVRQRAGALRPATVSLVFSEQEMRASLSESHVLVVESFRVTGADIATAPRLAVLQKFGTVLRNIDVAACAEAKVKVLTLRRRANIACAEHIFGFVLSLARKLHQLNGVVTTERLQIAGKPYRPFDRRHTPGGNYGRFEGLRMLNGSTVGIIGLGEIGREVAIRARAFGMRVVYHQRTQLSAEEEREFSASYVSLDQMLVQSDWIVPQLPSGPATKNLLGRAELARMRPGASIVNISNPDVVDREALIDSLRSGRLGGFALDPLYDEPARNDDELLAFENVILTPHMAGSPRSNGLMDFEDLITGIAKELAS
jgi:phosphoglycerate dehydrogenase-like enzyme